MIGDQILDTPQRWNRYAYVIDNPLMRVDPDGAADITVYYMRDTFTDSSTTGRMYVYDGNGSAVRGYFLEPPLGGDAMHPKGGIPAGDYTGEFREHLASHTSVQSLFIFKGVPGFSGIYAHNGNVPANSAGCLLYGNSLGKCDRVNGSSLFRKSVLDFFDRTAKDAKKPVRDLTIDILVMDGMWDTPPRPKDLAPDVRSTIKYGGEVTSPQPQPLTLKGGSSCSGSESTCPNF